MRNVKFAGIDSWNRPIFKEEGVNNYYGSTDILFNYSQTEDVVLEKVSEKDLTFFGSSFGCEPIGSPVSDIVIVPQARITEEQEINDLKKDLERITGYIVNQADVIQREQQIMEGYQEEMLNIYNKIEKLEIKLYGEKITE